MDLNTLKEMRDFVRYPNGTWKAKGGYHDDRVMSFMYALFILEKEITERYFDILMNRLESKTGNAIREHIIYKKSYCISDFKNDYHAYKGNAYGLANTLTQTHVLRPKLKSKKVNNLYFCGQLTVPGPGVPPSLISGKIVSELIIKYDS
mgnify:CR=1 FL=1